MVLDNKIAELEESINQTPISEAYVDLLNQLSHTLLSQDRSNQRALTLAKEAFELCTVRFPDYRTARINALITMAEYYRFQYNYAEALRLHLQAEALCLEFDDLNDWIRLRDAQSALASMMSDWTRYININLELLQLAQKAGQPRSEATAYNSLAVAYETMRNSETAISYREKAAAIAQALSDDAYYAFSLLGRSTPYAELKQYDQAIHYAQLAYEFYQGKNNAHEALNLGVLGHIYAEMGDYAQALHYFQSKLALITALDFAYFQPSTHCELGMVYQQMGDAALALHWLESGITLAEANNRKPILLKNYPYLVQTYKDHQDFEKALAIMEKLYALQLEIHDTTVDNQRNALLVLHETEQARVEAEIQRKRASDTEKQAQQDREYFAELSRLQKEAVYAMTHDLKNPLTIIVVKLETLKMRIDAQHHKHLLVIEDQAMRLNKMISDMLEIAKLETKRVLNLTSGSLVQLICEEIEQHTLQAERKAITIDFVQPADAFEYCFDSVYLKRALDNLISNAIKYSEEGTHVTLALAKVDEEIMICISDGGFGIAPQDLPFIFDRFYRVKDNHNIRGTGLGLSIVKTIVEQHQGRIHVDSTLGIGSTFTIYLPLQQSDCS